MVKNTYLPASSLVTQTIELKACATQLLTRLMDEQRVSDERQIESGQSDPMRCATGHSAIDSAISNTRQMIDEMEGLIQEMDVQLNGRHNGVANGTRYI